MKQRLLAGLVLAALFASTATRADVVLGAGRRSCTEWNSAEQPGGGIVITIEMVAWIQGYMSAAAPARHVTLRETLNPVALKEWFDGYCQRQPAALLQTATDTLLEALKTGAPPPGK